MSKKRWQGKESVNLTINKYKLSHLKNREKRDYEKILNLCGTISNILIFKLYTISDSIVKYMNYISVKLTKYDIFSTVTNYFNYFKVALLALSQQSLTFVSLESQKRRKKEIGWNFPNFCELHKFIDSRSSENSIMNEHKSWSDTLS